MLSFFSLLRLVLVWYWHWWQGLWKFYGIKDFNIIKTFVKKKKQSPYRDIYCYRDIKFVISWYKILVISPTPRYTVVIKGWTCQQQYSGRLWHLNDAQLVLKDQKCAKKISPTPLHHHQQPEPLRQGRMDPCFHVLYTKYWPYIWMLQQKSRLVSFSNILLSNFGESVNCSLCFFFLADRSGTRCGLLLLESICFRVWRVVCSEMYSADLGCNEWLFELLLPFYHL